jgi:hypothetical protein
MNETTTICREYNISTEELRDKLGLKGKIVHVHSVYQDNETVKIKTEEE